MRRRFQKPRIKNKGGYWIAQYRDLEGRKRKVSLGPVARTKKSDAERNLARLLEPVNSCAAVPTTEFGFGAFVRQVYLPFYRRKWKVSTTACNEGRIALHLVPAFDAHPLIAFTRDELQQFLDSKAADGHSYSVVAHLRWDLRQIFRMAVAEGCLGRNPAELLFIPRDARRFPKPRLTLEQVRLLLSVLDLRERVIAGFAILAGMWPGKFMHCAAPTLKKDARTSASGFIKGGSIPQRRFIPAVGPAWAMGSLHGCSSGSIRFPRKEGCLDLSLKDRSDANPAGQLLEIPFPASAQDGRPGMGQFSGHASHSRDVAR
jgi:hypothetical protein